MTYTIAQLARMRRHELQAAYLQIMLKGHRNRRAIEQVETAAAAATNDALMSRILDAQ